MEAPAFERFRSLFRGELVLPSDEGYEAARRVWNAAIDNHPALIARCSGVVDVVRAVEFAREHELLAAVRGGAHNVAGLGTCDGGIVIDLSRMRGIRLDLVRRTVRVEAGATWGDLDHETQAYEPKVASEARAGSARDGGQDRYLVRPKSPCKTERPCGIYAGCWEAGSRCARFRRRNMAICRYFNGSDGTRTRDLRRDRPAF
jgi:hypothetical protein